MTRPTPPCRGCSDRRVGCHDTAICPRWADYQAAHRAYLDDGMDAWKRGELLGEYTRRKQTQIARKNRHGG